VGAEYIRPSPADAIAEPGATAARHPGVSVATIRLVQVPTEHMHRIGVHPSGPMGAPRLGLRSVVFIPQ